MNPSHPPGISRRAMAMAREGDLARALQTIRQEQGLSPEKAKAALAFHLTRPPSLQVNTEAVERVRGAHFHLAALVVIAIVCIAAYLHQHGGL